MKILVFLFPAASTVIFLAVKIYFPDTYSSLVEDDSVVENAQAFLYFISSLLSLYVASRFLRSRLALHCLLYCILALGLLFVSLEEISWGQRIFNIPNTAYFESHNKQREISIHNLDIIQPRLHTAYILVGAYGAFAWIPLRLFLSRLKPGHQHLAKLVVPEWFISPYFFAVFLIFTLFKYVYPPHPGSFLVWRDQEPMELLLALGFFAFVATRFIELGAQPSETPDLTSLHRGSSRLGAPDRETPQVVRRDS